jgi:hypothetical protein
MSQNKAHDSSCFKGKTTGVVYVICLFYLVLWLLIRGEKDLVYCNYCL